MIYKSRLISGLGAYHSNKDGKPYKDISISEIIKLLKSPQVIKKNKAQWFIPSTLKTRIFQEQRERGEFYALWSDLDENTLNLTDLGCKYRQICGDAFFFMYYSAGATPERLKTRVIMPIRPVNGDTWIMLQKLLNDQLENAGVIPDRATERPAQLCYLPNRGKLYDFKINKGATFDPLIAWGGMVGEFKETEQKRLADLERRKEQARIQIQERIDAGQMDSIQAFKDSYPVDLMLISCGFVPVGKKFLSPLSESGIPGVVTKGNKWISQHGSDSIISKNQKNGATWGDSFDLFAHFQHAGNFNAALKAAGDMFKINGVSVTKYNQQEYKKSQKKPAAISDMESLRKKAKKILDSTEPCEEFDIKRLPPLLYDYMKAAKQRTSASPVMIVQSLICSLSACIGRQVFVSDKFFWQTLYPNLWCLSVAASSRFKTTALNVGSKVATQKANRILTKIVEMQQAIQRETDKKQISTMQDTIRDLQRQSPLLSGKSTAEALLDELANGQQGQILSSELGGWLKGMSATHQGNVKEMLTDYFDVPEARTASTRTGGLIVVQEPFITINGVSTVDWIQRNLEQDDVSSGFFARFLIFYPPKNTERPPSLPNLNRNINAMNEPLKALEGVVNQLQQGSVEYRFEGDARQVYDKCYHSLHDEIERQPERLQKILEPFLGRWCPYILKLATLFRPFEDPDSIIDPKLRYITPSCIHYAKYIVDYAIKSTTHLFDNQLGESEHQKHCRQLKEFVANKGGQCTWGQIIASKMFAGGSKHYETVVETLSDGGDIVTHKNGLKAEWVIKLN